MRRIEIQLFNYINLTRLTSTREIILITKLRRKKLE